MPCPAPVARVGVGRIIERVDVSEPASISTGIASRYATAIFELARDEGALDQVRRDSDTLASALNDSEDFRDLIHSPLYSRDQQQQAIGAIADKMGLHKITANTLRLMASKRRLFVLSGLISELRDMIAREKGEITADVSAATELSDAQKKKLAETLKASVGRDVNINLSVDESLIGGLVVKVGSKMIDTSIKSKLAALQNTMKEVG
nr:F0F1 ATP synthase subunit delta [Palleronia pontilimi]